MLKKNGEKVHFNVGTQVSHRRQRVNMKPVTGYSFSFYLGFLSRTLTIYRALGEGGGYPFNSSLPHRPASQALRR